LSGRSFTYSAKSSSWRETSTGHITPEFDRLSSMWRRIAKHSLRAGGITLFACVVAILGFIIGFALVEVLVVGALQRGFHL